MLDPWNRNLRGPSSALIQATLEASHAAGICGEACQLESLHAAILFFSLVSILVMMGCACFFFREDKEEQIKPLCPQLVVKESTLSFTMPASIQEDAFNVASIQGKTVCKIVVDWPDPFRPGASGVAATVRLIGMLDHTLTTLVARHSPSGSSLILCRESGDMFATVEPDGPTVYHVRHRTNVHLLTLSGDFTSGDVEGINPAGTRVCLFQAQGAECRGWVLVHVDAGLCLGSLMAVRVFKRMSEQSQLKAIQGEKNANDERKEEVNEVDDEAEADAPETNAPKADAPQADAPEAADVGDPMVQELKADSAAESEAEEAVTGS